MTQQVPAQDAAFLAEVVEAAKGLYASVGSMQPSAFIRTAPGALPGSPADMVVLAIPSMGGSRETKIEAINLIRHHSMRLGSPRTAILAESWSIEPSERIERELAELRSQGKGMGDHPEAREIVFVLVESDNGQTHLALTINRRHDWMAILEQREEATFIPRDTADRKPVIISDFHVPTAMRTIPQVEEWCRHMDAVYGDPRGLSEVQDEDHAAEMPDIPETTRH